MIEGSCHCGAVRVEVPRRPKSVTRCNCSICRRTGGLWAYFRPAQVRVRAGRKATTAYRWGDRSLELVRCARCGCVTHWRPVGRTSRDRMGVNMRNFEPAVLSGLWVRDVDGANDWALLGSSRLP